MDPGKKSGSMQIPAPNHCLNVTNSAEQVGTPSTWNAISTLKNRSRKLKKNWSHTGGKKFTNKQDQVPYSCATIPLMYRPNTIGRRGGGLAVTYLIQQVLVLEAGGEVQGGEEQLQLGLVQSSLIC